MNNQLCHYGVKGMKWGVRRNRTNSLSVDDYRNVKKTVDSSKNLVEQGKRYNDKKVNKKKQKIIKEDLSKMSDDELKAVVNRLNMEERYTQVMSSRDIKTGRVNTERILDNLGTALTLGSSALTIMIAMKELSK